MTYDKRLINSESYSYSLSVPKAKNLLNCSLFQAQLAYFSTNGSITIKNNVELVQMLT